MGKGFTYTLDNLIMSYVKSIVDPIKTENTRVKIQNQLLQESNADFRSVINNLRAKIDVYKYTIDMQRLEDNAKQKEITRITARKEKIKSLKKANEIALFNRISMLEEVKEDAFNNLREVIKRNKELYEYNKDLKKALNNELAELPIDVLVDRMKFIPFFTFLKMKIKKVFNRANVSSV